MKKIIVSFTIVAMLGLSTNALCSPSITSVPSKVKYTNKKAALSIGTNRASGEMQLRFTSDHTGKATITILNASGEIVLQQTEQLTISINTIPLKDATQLKEGSYTVRLVLNNETYHTRFMIWK